MFEIRGFGFCIAVDIISIILILQSMRRRRRSKKKGINIGFLLKILDFDQQLQIRWRKIM